MDSIQLNQDRGKFRAFEKIVMNFGFHKMLSTSRLATQEELFSIELININPTQNHLCSPRNLKPETVMRRQYTAGRDLYESINFSGL